MKTSWDEALAVVVAAFSGPPDPAVDEARKVAREASAATGAARRTVAERFNASLPDAMQKDPHSKE